MQSLLGRALASLASLRGASAGVSLRAFSAAAAEGARRRQTLHLWQPGGRCSSGAGSLFVGPTHGSPCSHLFASTLPPAGSVQEQAGVKNKLFKILGQAEHPLTAAELWERAAVR